MTPSQTPQSLPRHHSKDIIKQIQAIRQSKVITYYTHESIAQIADGAMPTLFRHLKKVGPQEKIDLWVHTRGGQTVTAWRVVQILREFGRQFGVLVPYRAHSAGTHIAMGADEIMMGPFSELGPVDPFRTHPLLPPGPDGKPLNISVQDLKHAIMFLRREAGKEGITPEAYSQIMPALFQHVHPLAIGAIEQSYELAKLISRKVLGTHMNSDTEAARIEEIANSFSDDFKDHTFQIGFVEAVARGLKAKKADDPLYNLMWELYEFYESLDRRPLAASTMSRGTQLPQGSRKIQIAHIDSEDLCADCILYFAEKDGKTTFQADEWVFV